MYFIQHLNKVPSYIKFSLIFWGYKVKIGFFLTVISEIDEVLRLNAILCAVFKSSQLKFVTKMFSSYEVGFVFVKQRDTAAPVNSILTPCHAARV